MAYAQTSATNTDQFASRQPAIKAAVATTYTLAVVFVGLRLLAKRLIRFSYWLDDWLLLAALLSLTFLLGDSIYGINNGVGKHYEILGPDVYEHFFIFLFVGWIFYATTTCLVKFSILALYWRVFQFSSIRMPIFVLTGIISCWGIATITTTIFQCQPISAYWHRTEFPGPCHVAILPFFASISVINIILDIAILILPIPYVLTLSGSLAQKAVICGIFLSGSLVIIIAILRMAYLVKDNTRNLDVTWNYTNVAIWSMPECAVAIISACLPSLRPIFRLLGGGSAQIAPTRAPSNTASGTASAYMPKSGTGQHALQHEEQLKKNNVKVKEGYQKSLPGLPDDQDQDQATPKDKHNASSYRYDNETRRRHNDGLPSNIPQVAEVAPQHKKVHSRTESPAWYDESDDAISLIDQDNRNYEVGRATKKMSVFYNL